ncbi:MAG: hypothetical protein ABSA83_22300 [Verrucomicrobiota bacterium]|jgi:hypothetical protein
MNFQNGRLRSLCVKLFTIASTLGLLVVGQRAEPSLKPLFPDSAPVCLPETLKSLSLPNTTIESAVVDASNRMCRVTAVVTHPQAGDRVKVWIGLPLSNWNGRFQGNGGDGFLGGSEASLLGPVSR